MAKNKQPDPSTADEVRHVTASDVAALPGLLRQIASTNLTRHGWYSFTSYAGPEDQSGRKILLIARQMLTITEAAARLGLSPSTVRGQVQKGKIRAKRIGERVLVIPEREVERYRAESLGRVGRHAESPKSRA